MTIMRSTPREFMTLREAMDRMFENAWLSPESNGDRIQRRFGVPVDIIERDGEIEVRATVPGYEPDDIDITVQADILTLRGETQTDEEKEGDRYRLRERRYGSFERTLRLPTSVNADQAKAEYKNGELVLTLPKTPESASKRIAVKQAERIEA